MALSGGGGEVEVIEARVVVIEGVYISYRIQDRDCLLAVVTCVHIRVGGNGVLVVLMHAIERGRERKRERDGFRRLIRNDLLKGFLFLIPFFLFDTTTSIS